MNKQLVVKTNRAEAVIYIILSVEELTTGRVIPKADVSTCDYWSCDTQGRSINL